MIVSAITAMAVALPPLMPVDQVEPGQKGQCLTVFEGDAIEPMDFEVKGVMRNFLGPKRDLVLVRLVGEKPEFTGVVAGMSGSPCSIDGKLVGALAYAFAMFAKEPIAGITPMDGMLDVMRLPEEPRPWRLPIAETPLGQQPSADMRAVQEEWDALRAGSKVVATASHQVDEMRPIAAPLGMGGVTPVVREFFDPWLRNMGFEPVASGSMGAAAEGPPLQPGSAVAAVLVRGDVEIAATGTVTSVEGDEVLAFGHPFFGAGAISLPMANATILNTMASQMRSYKMSLTGPTIGEVTQDRLTAIGGYLGKEPSMVRVSGALHRGAHASPFEFEVARDLRLSPRFIAVGLANALSGRVDAGERGTLRVKAEITVPGIPPVRIENVYAESRSSTLFVYPALDVGEAVAALWETPFGPPPDLQVRVEAHYEPDLVEEYIESIHVDRPQVRPGEAVEIAVRLRQIHGPVRHERFRLPIPKAWAGQQISFMAGSAQSTNKAVGQLAGRLQPRKLADVGRWYSQRRSDGFLYLVGARSGPGVRVGAEHLAFLPPSVVATLGGEASSELRGRGIAWEERRQSDGVVRGQASTSIKVLAH